MALERWQQVAEAFEAALEVDTEQRRTFLAKLNSKDPSLRSEVEALLAEDALQAKTPPSPIGVAMLPGKRIGGYLLVRVIGEGGMGVVFEAEQEHPRRIVALKVIKPGFAYAELLRRFERESQVLARLQHPGIAQIYEAGAADAGFGPQPYFALEFIHGVPLRDYADAHQLSTRQRLELMTKVCDAVQHAHERGIIHRDLKPGNILVDEARQPKILDFGVARLTDSDARTSRHTDVGQLVGTLAYMSPEQVTADPLELDTRSDVYALGVILYELLANRLPYQLSHQLPETVRAIREEDPAKLSSINRAYRGDVETIVTKALEKNKERRYSSAAALATDIRRYLADEPIMARPASTTYQLQKFARRHKALVVATAVVFAVLVAGMIVSTTEAVKARRAEQTAQAVNDFLQNDLLAQASASTQASPTRKPDANLKVRTVLDRAAAKIGRKFDRQPEVEASIRDTIGQAYEDLGLYAEAYTQFERALALQRRVLGAESATTLKTLNSLGSTATDQGKFPEAATLLSQSLESWRRLFGAANPGTLAAMSRLGSVYQHQGKYAQAETLCGETLETRRRVLGPEHPETLASMNNLAIVYAEQGKYAQAEALWLQTLEIRRRVLGPEHPATLASMNNLAEDYYVEGKYPQAEAQFSETIQIQRRVLGPEHPDTLASMSNFAEVYVAQAKNTQAEVLLSKTLEIQRRVLGAEHRSTLLTTCSLAIVYGAQGKYAKAEALLSQSLATYSRVMGREHPSTLTALAQFAAMYQRQGKSELAQTYGAQALAGRRHRLGSEHPETMDSAANLALTYICQREFIKAEPLAREAIAFYQKKQPQDWKRFRAESLLGASLAGQNKYSEAEPLLTEGYQGMAARNEQIDAPSRYHLDNAYEWLIQLYSAWGKPDKSAEWRKRKLEAPTAANHRA
jgi:tetratricopeptide (TPR) repeat protein